MKRRSVCQLHVERPLWSSRPVRNGNGALDDHAKFGAGKLSLRFRYSEPATGVLRHPAKSRRNCFAQSGRMGGHVPSRATIKASRPRDRF
jgi:hypothetical protein